MFNQLQVLFKTRGGHQEGMGDITSSLALAKEFSKRGHGLSFVVNRNPKVVECLSLENFPIIMEDQFYQKPTVYNQLYDIIIANQLNTPVYEMNQLREKSKILVTIDDVGEGSQLADLRFNVLYPIANSISDFKYIPLASTFQKKHSLPISIKKHVKNIVVTQGGSDTYGFTPTIVKALHCLSANICCNIVLGPNYVHFVQLEEALQGIKASTKIIQGESDLSNLMLEADLAISAGGITLFELACLGIPTIVVCGETFEEVTANRLQSEGFGINMGFGKQLDETKFQNAVINLISNDGLRLKMGLRGKELIDGLGFTRMVSFIIKFLEEN